MGLEWSWTERGMVHSTLEGEETDEEEVGGGVPLLAL